MITFPDPRHRPQPAEIASALGSAHALWTRLLTHVANAHGLTTDVWHFGKTTGWTLRLMSGKRIVLYLTPGRRSFTVGVVLGQHAVKRGMDEGAASLQALLRQGRAFTEGLGLRFAVADAEQLAHAETLADLKMAKTGRRP